MVPRRLKVPSSLVRRLSSLHSHTDCPAGSKLNSLNEQQNASNTLPKTAINKSPPPDASPPDSPEPWLLRLTGTSASLQPSDFYRLAPQSDHVHFWTTQSSLSAVVQARHPITKEALDHYTLYFESQAGALRYLDEAKRLHQESKAPDALLSPPPSARHRRRQPQLNEDYNKPWPPHLRLQEEGVKQAEAQFGTLNQGSQATRDESETATSAWPHLRVKADAPQAPTPDSKPAPAAWGSLRRRPEPPSAPPPDAGAPARAFTLAPPGIPLALSRPFQPSSDPAAISAASGTSLLEAAQTAQVLLVLSGGSGNGMSRKSLGRLIAVDGERRNLPWRLRGSASVLPVRVDMSPAARAAQKRSGVDVSGAMLRQALELTRARESSQGVQHDENFSRYVLSFEDYIEARRFSREWHRRRLVFNDGDKVFFVDATALW